MEALYLTPGAEARIWFHDFQQPATVNLESSNPAVISVPSTLAVGSNAVSFMAHGVAPGTATIRVLRGSVVAATLNVDVVAAGTKPRWPGALSVFADNSPVQLDKPVLVRLYPTGSAPYTGETASGPVTISSNGTVLAHVDLVSGGGMISVPIFFRNAGTQPLKVEYAGDANFLPSSNDFNVSMSRGNVTISAWTDRTGSSAAVHVRVTGSYLATPGGTITIGEAGKIPQVQSTLVPNSAGVGAADFVLNSVPAGQHTLLITYSGDSRYFNSTQNVRITDERRRSAPH